MSKVIIVCKLLWKVLSGFEFLLPCQLCNILRNPCKSRLLFVDLQDKSLLSLSGKDCSPSHIKVGKSLRHTVAEEGV